MKDTIIRQQENPITLNFDTAIKESNTKYIVEVQGFCTNFSEESSLLLDISIDKKDCGISLSLTEEDAEKLKDALDKKLQRMKRLREVNVNVINEFKNIEYLYDNKFIGGIHIEMVDEYPYGSNSNKTITIKVSYDKINFSKFKEEKVKLPEEFYVNTYLTGILSIDQKTYNNLMTKVIPITYGDRLQQYGKKYLKKAIADANKAMDNRMKKK